MKMTIINYINLHISVLLLINVAWVDEMVVVRVGYWDWKGEKHR